MITASSSPLSVLGDSVTKSLRTLDMLKIKITGFGTYSETHYLRNAYAYLTRGLLFHPTYSLHSRVIRLYLFMAFGVDYIMVRAGKSRNVQ